MKNLVTKYFFILLVLLVTVSFFGLISEFLLAILWAVILTILFYKTYQRIKMRMPKNPNLASALTLFYVLIIVIVPLGVVSFVVVGEANKIIIKMDNKEVSVEGQVQKLEKNIPLKQETLSKFGLNHLQVRQKIAEFSKTGTQRLAGYAVGFTQNLFGFFLNFFLMFYVFFFFLTDGEKLIEQLLWVIPMDDNMEIELLERFESVARATVKGSLIVAIVQGSIGGVLFWVLGIKAAFLWGVLMVLTSLLPIGSALVWGPWSLVLLYQGDITSGIILIAVGVGFIGLIDNFLRPRLVGKDTKMADYLVLLSTLGGISWFGISGFVIGPVVAALFITCWEMMGKQYGDSKNKSLTSDEG